MTFIKIFPVETSDDLNGMQTEKQIKQLILSILKYSAGMRTLAVFAFERQGVEGLR